MNNSIFTSQINAIYESLYMVNESVSSRNSRELMEGFEYGMNEGLGSFLKSAANKVGKMVGGVEQGISDIKKGVSDAATKGGEYFQKGVELAKKAWKSISEFAENIYASVKNGINTSVEYLKSAPGKIKEYMSGIYNQVLDSCVSAFQTLSDKAEELKTAIVAIWGNVVTSIKGQISNIKTAVGDGVEWLKANGEIAKTVATENANSSVAWVKKTAETMLELLKTAGSNAASAAKVAGYVAVALIALPVMGVVAGVKKLDSVGRSVAADVKSGVQAGVAAAKSGVQTGVQAVKSSVQSGVNISTAFISEMNKQMSELMVGMESNFAAGRDSMKPTNESSHVIMSFDQFIRRNN